MRVGALYQGGDRCEFVVWAPLRSSVSVQFTGERKDTVELEQGEMGYWRKVVEAVPSGTLYHYVLYENEERPDPASFSQPKGVFGPSEVVSHRLFSWNDEGWAGISLPDLVIYELHTGTFTPEGTFSAIIPRLGELRDLGINAIELMPVAQFSGTRNWGYDGVFPYAVHNTYGGPAELKTLVNACHELGMAVVLDVVYNHLGPEGNVLPDFGPYFTDTYRTPWGQAMNFDNADSDGVRNYCIENALYWFEYFHIDVLRLDACHAIYDMSARPFLRELAGRCEEYSLTLGRKVYLIAESDLNDVKLLLPEEGLGYGLDAQWHDEFHHALHVLLTGEKEGYYQDFGSIKHLAKAFKEGFVYSWDYSPFRRRHHGSSSAHLPAGQFVVCSQNHDQVGNRMLGERLSGLVSYDALKLAACAVICSPSIPLLFMGEEYGETAPFLYFIDHSDPVLIEAVRQGRREEFAAFHRDGVPPDPQDEETFRRSGLNWQLRQRKEHRVLLEWYRVLLRLRRENEALRQLDRDSLEILATEDDRLLCMRRFARDQVFLMIMNFNSRQSFMDVYFEQDRWHKVLDSADPAFLGSGMTLPALIEGEMELSIPAWSCALFEIEEWL